MTNQVIGRNMFHGYAGSYSRQPDTIIDTEVAGGAIPFGAGLVYDTGAVRVAATGDVAADFVGVACREVKSALNYASQNEGIYAMYEGVPVIKRGCVNVICTRGTAALDGDVYLRITANASYPDSPVGGFEASADSTYSVKLTNAKWKGAADANGVAEIRILDTLHA